MFADEKSFTAAAAFGGVFAKEEESSTVVFAIGGEFANEVSSAVVLAFDGGTVLLPKVRSRSSSRDKSVIS